MAYKIVISPVAKSNIKEAVKFYKDRASLKIAQNFVKDYEHAVESISISPFYRIFYKNFRGFPLKKYPYIIFYQVDETRETIRIKAIFHTSQDTQKRP